MYHNMVIHRFNTNHSEQNLINATRNGRYIEVPTGCWNELRMTKSSLADVFTTQPVEESFGCRGVKQYQQLNLIMIEYDMCLQDNVNWEMAKTRFQNFLHRKLSIDVSSVIIEGIVSTTSTWFIIEGTPALLKALKIRVQQVRNNIPNEGDTNRMLMTIAGFVAAFAVAAMIFTRR